MERERTRERADKPKQFQFLEFRLYCPLPLFILRNLHLQTKDNDQNQKAQH